MKKGYGRCTRCGCYCHAEFDSDKTIAASLLSGEERMFQVTPAEWVSDCCGATAEVWEEER